MAAEKSAFRGVVGFRRRAVRVDEGDVRPVRPGLREGLPHGKKESPPFRVGRGHMVGIRAGAVAGEKGPGGNLAGAAGAFGLQHDETRPFAQSQAAAPRVKGAARLRGRKTQGAETGIGNGRKGVRAAGEDGIAKAGTDPGGADAQGVRAGRRPQRQASGRSGRRPAGAAR